jgi:hypothetical protein
MELVLAHNDCAAIVLHAIHGFPEGVELRVITSVREPDQGFAGPARMHALRRRSWTHRP